MFQKQIAPKTPVDADLGGPPSVSPAVRLGGGRDQQKKKKFGGGKFGKGGSHGGFSKGGGVSSFGRGGRY